jgi:hypothetical protein
MVLGMLRTWAILALVVVLAGCASSGPGSPDAAAQEQAAALANTLQVPTWNVGDYWTWSSPQQDEPYTSVVSGENTDNYIMDTTSPNIAFFDARFDVSTIGLMRKSDLAGAQGSNRVEFFKFPMKAHLNWTTTWDGQPMKLHVMSVQDGVAMIHANRQDGTLYAMYTYVNKTGFFGEVKYYDATGTEVGFESKVTSTGDNFGGNLVRYQLDKLLERSGAANGAPATYPVPAGLTDVYGAFTVRCVTGAFALATGPPSGPADNRGFSANGPCPRALDHSGTLAAGPAQPEQWGYVSAAGDSSAATFINATIWGRTLLEFEVGKAPPLR